MAQVTIQQIDDGLIEVARQEARRRKISLNAILVDALRRGLQKEEAPAHKANLDQYAGDSDFGPEWDDFLEKDLKQVDEELWR